MKKKILIAIAILAALTTLIAGALIIAALRKKNYTGADQAQRVLVTPLQKYILVPGTGPAIYGSQETTVPVYPPQPSPNYIDIICSTYTVKTILYAPGLYFDLYKETCNYNVKRPVVISLHPSGISGVRTEFTVKKISQTVATLGYAGISPDYGFEADGGPFTPADQLAAICNIAALIRHLRANADTYGINPDNIIVDGLSGGGLTAVSLGIVAKEIDAGNPAYDNPINAQDSGFSSVPLHTASFAGAATAATIAELDNTCPANDFYHGTVDCTVYYSIAEACSVCGDCSANSGALDTYNAMIALGIDSTFVPYIGDGHGIVSHLNEILWGGDLQLDGVTVDPGIIRKYAALLT